MKILLSDTSHLDPAPLRRAGHDVVLFNESEPVPVEHRDAEAMVLWGGGGNGDPTVLAQMAGYLTRLRWIQTLAAGPDGVLAAGFDESVAITSGRHFHDLTVAEHAAALALACVRRLPQVVRAADRREWLAGIGGAQPLDDPQRLTTLLGARVLVWGFGAIGQATARLLTAFGATVRGVARSAGERAGLEVVAVDDVESVLPETDLLVMVLPSTPSTAGALSRERLALLPRRSVVVNVGRGSTVDQVALEEALRAGALSAAGLDVTDPEPLPAGSGLWDAPNVVITPHAAGGRPVGAAQRVLRNAALVEATPVGEPVTGLEALVRR
ncbi:MULTISPECIES: NAD(P)-dependent oxidoreductase [unclassified Actinomyces]|uniref:NAD(P)-dependent oxidoreductase n=1 Tax=unclassified Actinomyces TaxID=2609248 RepID=UPI0020174720|nr:MULTISPECIES: NAD(P)-dependent oxidoreductase [unclassified Actinomyces]MCL3778108.1 phosphoglycerate dehydrogenase [Actinomyces sp. AC-20-1]MCL3789829.1 phosphoglycerate dehydrogenase [Actinomyces sp. 187325]MCL3792999.1 phosphoglycerate dehydrogenase [Actinomyces sp. 186855]MCL3794707.1 phosphoglycerate dehydrogenase [Actinomyces sp. 217892]